MWFGLVFGFGVFVGVLIVLGIEAFVALAIINRLSQRSPRFEDPSDQLDHNQSLDFSFNKKGVLWVLPSSKVPKDWLDSGRPQKEQKKKKEFFEVSPVKKEAKLNGQTVILTESDGTKTVVNLKGCCVEAVSATHLSSRKWAKRFPIKLENKVSPIYKECKTLYIFLETSWDKESWCKALRLASSDDRSRLEWSVKLQKEFRRYLTSLNDGYPSFMKPTAGFYAAELVDRAQRNDGSSSKVRNLWKKLAKKASKGGAENRSSWPSLGYVEKKIGEKLPPNQDLSTSLLKNAQIAESTKRFVDDIDTAAPKFSYSGSQSQRSGISDADTDERLCIDEGTLCWNLLISRLFFDSKKNSEMKKSLQARIQRTLANMRTPSYIGEINCTDVDLGNIPPYIHGMRVLPMDTNEVWAFDVDIEYSGGVVLGIETRLEVRELDPEKTIVGPNAESSSVGVVSSELLEGFEYFGKRLDIDGGRIETPERKEESEKLADNLKSSTDAPSVSTNTLPASTNWSRWKSVVNNIAKQVSQVPISMVIRVASLRGTVRLHIKPPPSDQLWFSFTSMPDIDFNLDSAVGDHKITNGQIAVFLINRLKLAIQETLVLPNCESVCIPFMLAEKDDWVPRKVAPFMWIHHDAPNDSANSDLVLVDQPQTTEANRVTSNSNNSNNPNLNHNEFIQSVTIPQEVAPLPLSSSGLSDKTLDDLNTPLLGNNEEAHGKESNKGHNVTVDQSTSRSIVLADNQPQVMEEPKRIGRRARMFDIGKKVGDKLEEKRRHIEEKSKQIVEKMRGS